jgi:hypothetical protein
VTPVTLNWVTNQGAGRHLPCHCRDSGSRNRVARSGVAQLPTGPTVLAFPRRSPWGKEPQLDRQSGLGLFPNWLFTADPQPSRHAV